jgi:Tfp pilus assembly protein PilX
LARQIAARPTRRGGGEKDGGVALVLVVGTTMVMATLLVVGLAYVVSSTKSSRYDQDYTAAMTAAQSGVEDFIAHLNRSDDYGRTVDCSNDAMKTPAACGTPYGWASVVRGDTSDKAAEYHYKADASNAYTLGTINLVSTGRVNGIERTIEVAVAKAGSTDYVYYTDREDADPDNRYVYPSGTTTMCGRDGASLAAYWWSPGGRSGCTEIQFGTRDVLDGRVFSNDSILSKGGRFLQSVESANPDCSGVVAGNRNTWSQCLRSGSTYTATGASATFQVAPAYHTPYYLQDSSAAFATYPGCHYYGATRIIFNANGTMDVWSPSSDFTGAAIAVAPPGGTAPDCGSKAALSSTNGATGIAVPSDMVIYAAPAPTSGAGAVARTRINAGAIGGPAGHTLPVGTCTGAGPSNGSSTCTVDASMLDSRKYAGEGNLYVQGVVKGRVTLAAAQSVVVTGDVLLAGGPNGTDVVGLVASNSVEVLHPWMQTYSAVRSGWSYVWSSSPSGGAEYTGGTWPQRIVDPSRGSYYPSSGLQIAASIQALQHSFTVQRYGDGSPKGDLFVLGSIAQRWRGAVATSSGSTFVTGYAKDYRYDVRLRYTAPPYWPHWTSAQWSLRYSGEVRNDPTTYPWLS